MRTLKSFWFWFLVVWVLVSVATTWIFAIKLAEWHWWHTTIAIAVLAAGVFVALFLRQRQKIRSLSKGAESKSNDTFEESWKTSFVADVRKLLESSSSKGLQIGGTSTEDLSQKRIFWVTPTDFEAAKALLEAAGARDVTQSKRHELSGEFQNLGNWLLFRDMIFVLLREMPDARVPATVGRATLLLEQLLQRGKRRPVDGVLVLSPLPQRGGLAPQIHAAISFLAEVSMVEFPIYVGLSGAESLPGGASFLRVATEVPGIALGWTKQEELPAAIDKAWTELENDLNAKEDGLLATAWERGEDPAACFNFIESIRGLKEVTKVASLSCASQFVGRTAPFLRAAYLIPSGAGAAPPKPPADLAAGVFGSFAFDDGFSANPTASSLFSDVPAGTTESPRNPPLEAWLELIHKDPPLARLASHKQLRSSVLSLSLFVGAIVISLFLMWAALHGWVKGSSLDTGWKRRVAVAKSAPWTDAGSMRSSIPSLDDLDNLVEEIDHHRPWLLAPGYYRTTTLPLANAQLDSMMRNLVRQAFQAQELRLQGLLRQAADPTSDTRDIYGMLKVYLLSTRQGWAEGEDKEGEKGLADAYVRSWSDFLGYGQTLPAFERSVLPRIAERIAEKVSDGDSSWLSSQDLMLVQNARRELRNAKNQTGTYARLLASADTLPKLDWDSLGLPIKDVQCKAIVIGGAFTRRGWLEAIEPTLDEMGGGDADWVAGKAEAGEAAGQASTAEVLAELRRRYVEEFVSSWRALLDSSTCRLPADNQRIGSALQTLSSPYTRVNPKGVQAFFNRFLEETNLKAPPDTAKPILTGKLAKTAGKIEKMVTKIARLLPTEKPVDVRVAEQLSGIRLLATGVSKGQLDAYVKDLAQLGSMFSQWTGADGAFQFAKGVSGQDARNPLVHAWNEALSVKETLPADLRPWFDAFTIGILRQVSARAMPQAQVQANAMYKEKVWQPWQNLTKGSYPFDPYAENEATINDIDAILNPRNGSLALYLKDMEGLVVLQGEDIRSVGWNGMGLSIDPAASEQLRKMMKIATYFYGKGGTAWKGVGASVTVRGDSRAKVTLQVGTQILEIPQGGEKRLTFRWPQSSQAGVSLKVSTINQTFEEHRDGDWALLRLLESKGVAIGDATWSFNDRSYIVDVPISVRLDQAGGPFSDREFFHISLVPDPFR